VEWDGRLQGFSVFIFFVSRWLIEISSIWRSNTSLVDLKSGVWFLGANFRQSTHGLGIVWHMKPWVLGLADHNRLYQKSRDRTNYYATQVAFPTKINHIKETGWWFLKYLWNFWPRSLGKWCKFDLRIFFQMGGETPPTRKCFFGVDPLIFWGDPQKSVDLSGGIRLLAGFTGKPLTSYCIWVVN